MKWVQPAGDANRGIIPTVVQYGFNFIPTPCWSLGGKFNTWWRGPFPCCRKMSWTVHVFKTAVLWRRFPLLLTPPLKLPTNETLFLTPVKNRKHTQEVKADSLTWAQAVAQNQHPAFKNDSAVSLFPALMQNHHEALLFQKDQQLDFLFCTFSNLLAREWGPTT